LFLLSVADGIHVHQRRTSFCGSFRPNRSKKASHCVKERHYLGTLGLPERQPRAYMAVAADGDLPMPLDTPSQYDRRLKYLLLLLLCVSSAVPPALAAEEPDLIFRRSTVFKWVSPNDKLAT
jgi:hypothetical protein